MFEWLGDIIGGIGDAIGGTFEGISDALANSIFEAMLAWLYETIYGAIADFFELMGNMGAEIFDLTWVQAVVKLFTLFGWSLFVAGLVVAIFDVAIEYQNGRASPKTTALNILKGFYVFRENICLSVLFSVKWDLVKCPFYSSLQLLQLKFKNVFS